jgi:hypothetical protein
MAPTYKGPYSSDDGFEDFTKGMSRDASYPSRVPNKYTDGPPCKGIDANGVPFGAIDLSSTIDKQDPFGSYYGFDDQHDGNWSKDKSDAGRGGFSGAIGADALLPGGRASNHPTRSSLNARGKAGPQVGGKNK